MKITISKTVTIPNPIKVERYKRIPEMGPAILFFSGGSALREVSRLLYKYTHNSIHLMTPFDSGGSSASIRKKFQMLSVGDVRARLMDLADKSIKGNPDIYKLFSYRFPKTDNNELKVELNEMIDGNHPLIVGIMDPMRQIICSHLHFFRKKAGDDFDLGGASVGNLILAGGFLNNNRNIAPVIYMFSKLVHVRGQVMPSLDQYLHLGVKLRNGETIIGQHLITGKEVPPIKSPIKEVFITSSETENITPDIAVDKDLSFLISKAELIVYPYGSYFSSILVNMLIPGMGEAVRNNGCPKVYIPNPGKDPEQLGMSLSTSVKGIISALKESSGFKETQTPITKYLDLVIIDLKHGEYSLNMDVEAVREMGIQVISMNIVSKANPDRIDPKKLSPILLSLV